MSVPRGQEERPDHGSLLDPRTHGWVLKQSWEGLFDLYTRDGEAQAQPSLKLNAIATAQLQGYSAEDKAVEGVKGMLLLSALMHQTKSEGVQHIKSQLADRFISEFGEIVLRLLGAKTSYTADQEALAAANLIRRAASAIGRMKFPRRGKGRGSYPPKAVMAISHALRLCEHLRRLPTKREVRASLEEAGVGYGRSKDPDSKWVKLFVSAGLASLPE